MLLLMNTVLLDIAEHRGGRLRITAARAERRKGGRTSALQVDQ